jgi:hypothetical protein
MLRQILSHRIEKLIDDAVQSAGRGSCTVFQFPIRSRLSISRPANPSSLADAPRTVFGISEQAAE